jgi:hypothetical protein
MNKIQIFSLKEMIVVFSLPTMLLLISIFAVSFLFVDNRPITVRVDGSYIPAVMISNR